MTRGLPIPGRGRAAAACLLLATLIVGCAAVDKPPPDPWPALREARPASVLVLPPMNDTPDVEAPASVMAQAVVPLAEAGYYVLPVALVAETLRANGVQTAYDARQISARRLREVFGADAVLQLDVKAYGSVYRIVSSDAVVTVEGRLVDLRDGRTLWTGRASASSAEQRGQPQGGWVGLLVQALVEQVASNFNERNHQVAGVAMRRLLGSGSRAGLLPGPRAPPAAGGR